MEPTSYLSLMKFKFDQIFIYRSENFISEIIWHFIFSSEITCYEIFYKISSLGRTDLFSPPQPVWPQVYSFRPLTNDLYTSEAISLTGNQLCTFSLWISLQISPRSLHSPAFRARQPAVDPPGSLPWPGRRPDHLGASTGFACTYQLHWVTLLSTFIALQDGARQLCLLLEASLPAQETSERTLGHSLQKILHMSLP